MIFKNEASYYIRAPKLQCLQITQEFVKTQIIAIKDYNSDRGGAYKLQELHGVVAQGP